MAAKMAFKELLFGCASRQMILKNLSFKVLFRSRVDGTNVIR
jgi:hypothetical protein